MKLFNESNSDLNSELIKSLKNKVVKRDLLLFFVITITISWLFWIPALLKAYGIDLSLPEDTFIIIGNFTPSILGLILTVIIEGKTGILETLKRLLKFKFKLKWYIYTILLMPSVLFAAYIISYFFMELEFNSILIPIILDKKWIIIPMLIYFIFMQGPVGEEFGWRAFALPRLLRRYNPLKASLIIGIIWSFWHLPKFFLIGSTQFSITYAYGIILALTGYALYTIMLSIMITYLYINTGKSILSVILFHAMANFSHGLITILTDTVGAISIVLVMFLVTFIIIFRFRKEFYTIKA